MWGVWGSVLEDCNGLVNYKEWKSVKKVFGLVNVECWKLVLVCTKLIS